METLIALHEVSLMGRPPFATWERPGTSEFDAVVAARAGVRDGEEFSVAVLGYPDVFHGPEYRGVVTLGRGKTLRGNVWLTANEVPS